MATKKYKEMISNLEQNIKDLKESYWSTSKQTNGDAFEQSVMRVKMRGLQGYCEDCTIKLSKMKLTLEERQEGILLINKLNYQISKTLELCCGEGAIIEFVEEIDSEDHEDE